MTQAPAAKPASMTGRQEKWFASVKPVRGGKAILGLALLPDADPRLETPMNEGWSERLKSKLTLDVPSDVDARLLALLRQAWEQF